MKFEYELTVVKSEVNENYDEEMKKYNQAQRDYYDPSRPMNSPQPIIGVTALKVVLNEKEFIELRNQIMMVWQ